MAQITLNSTGVASNGTLALQSNGTTTAVTIDTSQNVGIGTASPFADTGYVSLDIRGSSTGSQINLGTTATRVGQITCDTTNGLTFNTATSTPIRFFINGGERARIDTSGNVGIGTSSPSTYGKVAIGISGTASTVSNTIGMYQSAGADFVSLRIAGYDYRPSVQTAIDFIQNSGTNFQSQIAFSTNGGAGIAERMRIDTSGNLLVARTSATFLGGAAKFGVEQTSSGAWGIGINANNNAIVFNHTSNTSSSVGSITVTTSATAYNTSSDYRLKNTIAPMTGALAKVDLLKPVTYKWNFDGSSGEGFIAHELQAVVPDAVTGEKDAVETYTDEDGVEQTRPVYQGIDTSFLVATLTAAIQELKALVDTQASTITQLQADVAALKGTA